MVRAELRGVVFGVSNDSNASINTTILQQSE